MNKTSEVIHLKIRTSLFQVNTLKFSKDIITYLNSKKQETKLHKCKINNEKHH